MINRKYNRTPGSISPSGISIDRNWRGEEEDDYAFLKIPPIDFGYGLDARIRADRLRGSALDVSYRDEQGWNTYLILQRNPHAPVDGEPMNTPGLSKRNGIYYTNQPWERVYISETEFWIANEVTGEMRYYDETSIEGRRRHGLACSDFWTPMQRACGRVQNVSVRHDPPVMRLGLGDMLPSILEQSPEVSISIDAMISNEITPILGMDSPRYNQFSIPDETLEGWYLVIVYMAAQQTAGIYPCCRFVQYNHEAMGDSVSRVTLEGRATYSIHTPFP